MRIPVVFLRALVVVSGTLVVAAVLPTAAATATATATAKCAAALFTIKSGLPGAGTGYAQAKVAAKCSGSQLVVTSNGMPSYKFVAKTPNALKTQKWTWKVPLAPTRAAATTNINRKFGTIGFTVTGIPIYGPMEGPMPTEEAFGDPVYNGILDSCKGHTGPASEYHDHAIAAVARCGFAQTRVVGYALDGFPIYGPSTKAKSGYIKTGDPKKDSWAAYAYQASSDPKVLDECNGRTKADGSYGYYITETFPYIIGCYRGTPTTQSGAAAGPMPPMG